MVNKLSKEDKQSIINMANMGLMDSEIAEKLHVSPSAIFYWRKKLNIKSQFNYAKISKIDNDKFKTLFNAGLSDYAIAKELNMSPDGVYSHRIRHNYIRNKDLRYNTIIVPTEYQKQVLVGTILGDSSIYRETSNPRIICSHCIAQKEYCLYKTKIFTSLGAKCTFRKRGTPDKRNGIFYESYNMYIPCNPAFKELYEEFYPEGKKVIPMNLMKYFSEVSLAFLFMDDGTKMKSGYKIATNCFSKENIKEFSEFLNKKWGINSTIHKDNGLYIKANSKALFKYLISPYICECMKYKL